MFPGNTAERASLAQPCHPLFMGKQLRDYLAGWAEQFYVCKRACFAGLRVDDDDPGAGGFRDADQPGGRVNNGAGSAIVVEAVAPLDEMEEKLAEEETGEENGHGT